MKQTKKIGKKKGVYYLWEDYNEFVRNLHLEENKKESNPTKTLKEFLIKQFVLCFGALLNVLALTQFLKPFSIYNSGLSSLTQRIIKVFLDLKIINEQKFLFYNYSANLIISALIVIYLWVSYNAKLKIISTSIFYILYQLFWSQIVNRIFNSPSIPENAKFADYLINALLASLLNAFGYSLIFQAKASPGGLDIITAHFDSNKEKDKKINHSIIRINKLLSILVLPSILLIDLFSFLLLKKGKLNETKVYHFNYLYSVLASISHIAISSVFLEKFYPKQKIVRIEIHCEKEYELDNYLKLLEDFSPYYVKSNINNEQSFYVVSCYLSKWNYFLLEPEIKKNGEIKIYINETS